MGIRPNRAFLRCPYPVLLWPHKVTARTAGRCGLNLSRFCPLPLNLPSGLPLPLAVAKHLILKFGPAQGQKITGRPGEPAKPLGKSFVGCHWNFKGGTIPRNSGTQRPQHRVSSPQRRYHLTHRRDSYASIRATWVFAILGRSATNGHC